MKTLPSLHPRNPIEGMINGLSKEFSTKTEAEQKRAFADLLLSPVMNADFTNAKVNGKNVQSQQKG